MYLIYGLLTWCHGEKGFWLFSFVLAGKDISKMANIHLLNCILAKISNCRIKIRPQHSLPGSGPGRRSSALEFVVVEHGIKLP